MITINEEWMQRLAETDSNNLGSTKAGGLGDSREVAVRKSSFGMMVTHCHLLGNQLLRLV